MGRFVSVTWLIAITLAPQFHLSFPRRKQSQMNERAKVDHHSPLIDSLRKARHKKYILGTAACECDSRSRAKDFDLSLCKCHRRFTLRMIHAPAHRFFSVFSYEYR